MSTKTLTAALPPGTLYVSGTVNGVATTWTNTHDNTWETVAERSPQDVYVVALTIIDQTGRTTEAGFTLYYGLHLVTDRTEADVSALAEAQRAVNSGTATAAQASLAADDTAKGGYNATDLNRVGAAMQYVADRLRDAGYDPEITPKTDWLDSGWANPESMGRYLMDLETLRSQFAVPDTTPETPGTMEKLKFSEANNIERILEDLDRLLTNIMTTWFYSGDIYSGEGNT